jgi:hypothetical protein
VLFDAAGDELPSSIEVQLLAPDLLAKEHAKMQVWFGCLG